MTIEERCTKIIRQADKARGETDERRLRQLMQEIYMLTADYMIK